MVKRCINNAISIVNLKGINVRLLIVCLVFFMYCIPTNSFAAGFAQLLGAYKADSKGQCKKSEFLGQLETDFLTAGVCIPSQAMIDPITYDLIPLALTELNKPQLLPQMIEMHKEARKPVDEAFIVQIDEYDDDIFKLVDGSIIENNGGYVGYTGYNKKSILFKKNGQWKICVNDNIHRVTILKNVSSHYSRAKIDKSVSEKSIEEMDECD